MSMMLRIQTVTGKDDDIMTLTLSFSHTSGIVLAGSKLDADQCSGNNFHSNTPEMTLHVESVRRSDKCSPTRTREGQRARLR